MRFPKYFLGTVPKKLGTVPKIWERFPKSFNEKNGECGSQNFMRLFFYKKGLLARDLRLNSINLHRKSYQTEK